ncbi:MAG TPA: hypothetical protein VMF69_05190, partial [Gemmataceae bacterium]|nr:hypothetical protein [Gemmataceae bacterium]
MLEVASDPIAGYMPCQVWADDTFAYDSVTADIRVKKGVVITGKVIDQATGKSVPGWAMTDILSDNPFVKDYPPFDDSAFVDGRERTGEDGAFRVVAIPGPVVLIGGRGPDSEYYRPGGNIETKQYKPASADANYPRYFHKYPNRTAYFSYRGTIPSLSGHFCKVLEIKPGATTVNQNVFLERVSALALRIQDAEGRP